MNPEKTITIAGKEVRMRYCAATETGFEQLSGKSISEINFTLSEDLLRLSLASIIAAYSKDGQESPITSDDLLYNANPNELTELFTAVIMLRAQWYGIPEIVKPETKEKQEKKKKN